MYALFPTNLYTHYNLVRTLVDIFTFLLFATSCSFKDIHTSTKITITCIHQSRKTCIFISWTRAQFLNKFKRTYLIYQCETSRFFSTTYWQDLIVSWIIYFFKHYNIFYKLLLSIFVCVFLWVSFTVWFRHKR